MRQALALLLALAAPAFAQSFAERPEVQAFIGEVSQRHGFPKGQLDKVFAKVQRVEPALQLILPGERLMWDDYRAQFINDRRIEGGLAFWKANRSALRRAEKKYGVPAQYIVGIIGVETNYGRNMGRYRVIDALSTLAFDYPPRASFFRRELEQYLVLSREAHFDIFSQRGSYAGAIGLPQFMPSSLRRYAVDFSGDGRIDLTRSASDAVGSVGNFLKEHGWQTGEPVLYRAKPAPEALARYFDGSVDPNTPLADLQAAGLELDPTPQSTDALGALIPLGAEYRVGLKNFWVITRYNRSTLYAAAVSDLADELVRAQSVGR